MTFIIKSRLSLVGIGACLFAALSPVAAACGDDAAVIAGILKTWAARQARVQTIKAEWTTKRHMEAGSQMGKEMREGVFPPTAVDTELKSTFLLDSDRWRHEEQGSNWNNMVERMVPEWLVRTYDGGQFRMFRGVISSDLNELHDRGSIMPPQRSASTTLRPQLAPLLLNFRPLVAGTGHFTPEFWEPRPKVGKGVANGHDCMVVDFVNLQHPGQTKQCWVAPSLDNSVVRWLLGNRLQLEIEYRTDSEHGPIPKSWQVTQFSPDGKRVDISDATVVKSLEINAPVDTKQLTFEFPVGSEVDDYTKGDPPTSYLVRSEEAKRELTLEERTLKVPYDELMKTSTGERLAKRGTGYYYYVGLALATVVVGVVGFRVLWTRFERNRDH